MRGIGAEVTARREVAADEEVGAVPERVASADAAMRDAAPAAGVPLSPWVRAGPRIFGLAIAALGVQSLALGDHIHGLAPVPRGLPGRVALAYLTGLLLVGAGAGLVAGVRVRTAAATVGVVCALWFVLLQLPALAAHAGNGSVWTVVFETVALGGAAWALAASRGAADDVTAGGGGWARAALAGRLAFGAALCVFGALHLIYHDVVASLVPHWIPGPLFWAYATGFAHLAAGLSLLTGVARSLGATLVGLMFGLWVLIVHAPRVAAAPGNREEWTSLLIALAMCGASWSLAGAGPLVRRARGGAGPLRAPRAARARRPAPAAAAVR